MIIRNRLDKSFGPMPAFAGIVLSVAGILMICHLTGISLLVAGALLATATDETTIDTDRKRIRSGTRLLWMFTLGKWQEISEFTGVTLIPVCRKYSVNSRSNQQQTSGEKDYRIYILDKLHKPAFALEKFAGRSEALEEMDRLAQILQLPVFSHGEK